MRLRQLIFILMAVYFCTGCKATRVKVVKAPPPPLPPSPLIAARELAVVEPSFSIGWCYPFPDMNIVFEVWNTTNMAAPFKFLAETPDLRFTKPVDQNQEFFKVRAKNTVTGEVSGWATSEPCP